MDFYVNAQQRSPKVERQEVGGERREGETEAQGVTSWAGLPTGAAGMGLGMGRWDGPWGFPAGMGLQDGPWNGPWDGPRDGPQGCTTGMSRRDGPLGMGLRDGPQGWAPGWAVGMGHH